MTDYFPAHTVDTAPEEVRGALRSTEQKLGFVPSMLAKFAEAPALLIGYQTLAPFFEKTSLDSTERLVVLLTASYRHNCDFCMTAHSWFADGQGIDKGLIRDLREGKPLQEPRLEALRNFIAVMLEKRGAVSEDDKRAFFNAGYTPRQALEVVLGIALKTTTNYTNALAHTPPNPEFGDAIWRRHA
jgi:alkylhydroperoxidase family enzyme